MAETYKAYVVSPDKTGYIPIVNPPAFDKLDYNDLNNVPIKNLDGKIPEVYVDISALDEGKYTIDGYYKLDDDSELHNADGHPLSITVKEDPETGKKRVLFEDFSENGVAYDIVTFANSRVEESHSIAIGEGTISDIDDEIDSINTKIDEINSDINGINSEITDIKSDVSDINRSLVNANDDITVNKNAIETLNGNENTEGSVSHTAKSYVDALDGTLATAAKSGDAKDVTVSSEAVQATNVTDAIDELAEAINDAVADSAVTLVSAQTPDTNDSSTYILSQGNQEIGRIHLAKDLVATKGELVNQDGNGNRGTFIKMTIANGTPFYIPVEDLIDIYQGSGDAHTINTGIEVKIIDSIIYATAKTIDGNIIDNGSIVLGKLSSVLQNKINHIEDAVFEVSESSTNGSISVDGTDVSVHGLKSAAYQESSAFDENGAAQAVKDELMEYLIWHKL